MDKDNERKTGRAFWKSKVVAKAKGLGRFIFARITKTIGGVYRFFRALVTGILNFFKNLYLAAKHHPRSFLKGLSSFFLMGLGQFRNKQPYKGALFLGIFLVFLLTEFLTGDYIYAPAEIARYPAENTLYFFRDYGGLFTRGIWGFFTLGALTVGDMYRGSLIVNEDFAYDWLQSDNSRTLMGEGVIVLVLVAIFAALWIFSVRDAYITDKKIRAGMEIERFKEWIRRIWDQFFAYIIIIPAVGLILFFILMPFLFSFLVGFTNYDASISLRSDLIEWHGFATFREVFGIDPAFRTFFLRVLGWTTFYAAMSSFTVYVMGFFQAVVIESRFVRYKKLWRLVLILPWAVPGMISLIVFSNIFGADGLMNRLLADWGVTDTVRTALESLRLIGEGGTGTIEWFTRPANANLARFLVLTVNLWMGYPYFMLLITGVLSIIPRDLYEAADIDGGSTTQKFRYIPLPWVVRATAPVIITTFTFNFNNFGAIYFLTGGGPRYLTDDIPRAIRDTPPGQTDILISWIYKIAFESGDHNAYNLAAVYSILVFILIAIVSLYYLSRLKSFWEED